MTRMRLGRALAHMIAALAGIAGVLIPAAGLPTDSAEASDAHDRAPRRAAVDLVVGPATNASRRAGNQSEPTIAVNPANPRQIAVFSNDDSSVPGLFAATSGDGGATWTGRTVFGAGSQAACCDAQATFDRFGNLFLTYLGNDRNIYLAASSDAGASFPSVAPVTTIGAADQPSLAVGPGGLASLGSVWVAYHNGAVIAARSAAVGGLGAIGPLAPEQPAPGALGGYGDIEVGPGSQVLVTYQNEGASSAGPSQIFVHLDPDGLGPAPFSAAVRVTQTQVGITRFIPATSNSLGVDAEANLAWDRSDSAYRGRVYLVYTDAPSVASNDLDIYVRFSDDNGVTWSAALRVNDDAGGPSQFLPAIAVDQQSGRVGIDWYDARASPDNREAQIYAAVSAPGGQLFAANVRLAPALSNAATAETGGGPFRPLGFGDYITNDFHAGTFYAVWADNSPALGGNPALPRLDLAVATLRVVPRVDYRVYMPLALRH